MAAGAEGTPAAYTHPKLVPEINVYTLFSQQKRFIIKSSLRNLWVFAVLYVLVCKALWRMFGLFTTGGRIGASAIALLIFILVSWYKTNSFVLVQVEPPWFGLPDRVWLNLSFGLTLGWMPAIKGPHDKYYLWQGCRGRFASLTSKEPIDMHIRVHLHFQTSSLE